MDVNSDPSQSGRNGSGLAHESMANPSLEDGLESRVTSSDLMASERCRQSGGGGGAILHGRHVPRGHGAAQAEARA